MNTHRLESKPKYRLLLGGGGGSTQITSLSEKTDLHRAMGQILLASLLPFLGLAVSGSAVNMEAASLILGCC